LVWFGLGFGVFFFFTKSNMDKSKKSKKSKKESKESKESKEDPETKESKESKESKSKDSHDDIKLLFDRRPLKNTIDFYIQPTTKKSLKKSRRKEKKLRKKLKKISKETKIEKLKENGIINNNNNVPDDIINVIFDNMV
jgi:hypothetical protein